MTDWLTAVSPSYFCFFFQSNCLVYHLIDLHSSASFSCRFSLLPCSIFTPVFLSSVTVAGIPTGWLQLSHAPSLNLLTVALCYHQSDSLTDLQSLLSACCQQSLPCLPFHLLFCFVGVCMCVCAHSDSEWVRVDFIIQEDQNLYCLPDKSSRHLYWVMWLGIKVDN